MGSGQIPIQLHVSNKHIQNRGGCPSGTFSGSLKTTPCCPICRGLDRAPAAVEHQRDLDAAVETIQNLLRVPAAGPNATYCDTCQPQGQNTTKTTGRWTNLSILQDNTERGGRASLPGEPHSPSKFPDPKPSRLYAHSSTGASPGPAASPS